MNSIKTRLLLFTLLAITGTLAVTLWLLFSLKANLIEDRKVKTQHLVESAVTLVAHYHAQVAAGVLDDAGARIQAIQALKAMRYDSKEYFWINDMQAVMVMHPMKPELDGKDLSAAKDPNGKALFLEFVRVIKEQGAGFVDYYWPKPGSAQPVAKISYVKGFAPWGWVIGSGIYLDDVQDLFLSKVIGSMEGIVVMLALILGVSWKLSRSITRPLAEVVAQSKRAVENNDFTVAVSVPGTCEIGQVAVSVNDLMDKLRHVASESREASVRFIGAANDLAGSAQQIRDSSHHQAEAAASVAANIEEISVAISETASHTHDAEAMAGKARQESEHAMGITRQTVANIENIAASIKASSGNVEKLLESSNQISGIVNVIKEIAEQTNLLALNAAIEAARAGEQGRGFAVVADEVRKLAERTSGSTQEIGALIGSIQSQVNNAVQTMRSADQEAGQSVGLANQANEALHVAMVGNEQMNKRIHEITLSVREQDAAVRMVAASIENIAQMTEKNSASADNNSDIANRVEQEAQSLRAQISRYRV
jgi:methyl-accepting chemotaxis protein